MLEDRLDDIGYAALFIYSFGGGFVGLATAAVMASLGKLSLGLSILLAGAANFIGSTIIFYFAKNSKTEALGFLKKHRRKLALMHLLMRKRGSIVILLTKFIYGLKTIAPLTAGITKYDAKKFIFLNFLASFAWAISIGVAAYLSGGVILEAVHYAKNYPFAAPIVLALIVGTVYLIINKITKKENTI